MTRASATQAGFTLLELLVALVLFAVLSMLAYGGVRHVLALESGLLRATLDHDRLRFAIGLLEQDLDAAAPRPVRDALGDPEPALRAGIAGDLLSVTRFTPALAGGAPRVALRRIRYRLEDGVLFRDVWQQLDRTPATPFHTRRLLTGVAALRLRFFVDGTWIDFWPRGDAAMMLDDLPRGVEFRLELDDRTSVRRVLLLPG